MKFKTENINLILIFLFITILSFYQSIQQNWGYVVDQDWTIIYNSLLVISNFEQEYIDHPAYTTFLLYGNFLKLINVFFNLNLNIPNILNDLNANNNLQNIFISLRIINSLIIFSIYLVSYKILKLFNISNYYISLILLIFLSFNSIYQLLFLLRSEALSVLLFLISNYFFLKYLLTSQKNIYIIIGSIFFSLSMLAKTQIILLYLCLPFILILIKNKFKIYTKEFTFNNNYLYLFTSILLFFSLILYSKYSAPTELMFFIIYLIVFLIFVSLIKKISIKMIKEYLSIIILFSFGVLITFVFIVILDLSNIVKFDYSIIGNNFSRPISHMAAIQGYDISNNILTNIASKQSQNLFSIEGLVKVFTKNIFFIFLIPILFLNFIKKSNINLLYSMILFVHLFVLSSLFLFERNQPFYQIYLIPILLYVLIEFSTLNKKIIFLIFTVFFLIVNLPKLNERIFLAFDNKYYQNKVCFYNKSAWNLTTRKLNYEKFKQLICS